MYIPASFRRGSSGLRKIHALFKVGRCFSCWYTSIGFCEASSCSNLQTNRAFVVEAAVAIMRSMSTKGKYVAVILNFVVILNQVSEKIIHIVFVFRKSSNCFIVKFLSCKLFNHFKLPYLIFKGL